MPESLLSLSNILLFGQTVEDIQVVNLDPAVATNVNAATTPPPLAALNGHQTVDGVNLTTNDLVLVKDQGNPNENGVYTVGAASAAWVRDQTIPNGSVVTVAAGGTDNGGTNWLVRRSVHGGNIHYRFDDPADRLGKRHGVNQQLADQLSDLGAQIAKIYGYSYEGCYYDLARPTLFLVHGDGEPLTQVSPAAPAAHPARAPRDPSETGVSVADFQFADDIRFWSYDKGDFSIRMDVTTGMLEDILLEAEVDARLQMSSAARMQTAGSARMQISHAARMQMLRRSGG